MFSTAVYYPHTTLRDVNLLKNALVLWDRVEFISPFEEFRPETHLFDGCGIPRGIIDEAFDLVVRPYIPTVEDRSKAHELIVGLVSEGLPEWFFFRADDLQSYSIYPQKFLKKTWTYLEEKGIVALAQAAAFDDGTPDYQMNTTLGLSLMAILADVCAGTEKRTITDRSDGYSGLTRAMTAMAGGRYEEGTRAAEAYDRLVTISLKTINTKKVGIKKLVALRRREAQGKDTCLPMLRQNYLAELDNYVERMMRPGLSAGDRSEVERQFEAALEADLKRLNEELLLHGKNTLLSREVVGAAVATAFSTVEPVTSSITSVGLLTRILTNYQAEKNEIMKKHATSWLYNSKPSLLY